MKVAALIHFSLPWRCAGSEVVAHELMKAAAAAGHEVTVWCTNQDSSQGWRGDEPDTVLDGVTIKRVRNVIIGGRQLQSWKPDVVLSHHQHILHAVRVSRVIKARSVFLTHNQMDINRRPLLMKPDLVIHNSEWVRESLSRFGPDRESMVFHPPLTPDRHTVASRGDRVTLVNLNEHKGAHLFYKLAETMPDRRFMGVVGGHGVQVVRRDLPNVKILEHGPDMRRVWSQTRVLLMPSVYESYGLVAQEAGVNGIPTVANPTPGLLENLGVGGLFADRDSPDQWADQLTQLDDQSVYAAASAYATGRAQSAMDATREALTRWCGWLDTV